MDKQKSLKPFYVLDPGNYVVQGLSRDIKKVTTLETDEPIVQIRGKYLVLLSPTNFNPGIRCKDKATGHELGASDPKRRMSSEKFEEFKTKLRGEMVKSGERIHPSEFREYTMDKGMTPTNVVQLLITLFGNTFNVPFDYLKSHLSCRVVQYPRRAGYGKVPAKPRIWNDYSDDVHGDYDYAGEPKEIDRGAVLNGGEYVLWRWFGRDIIGFPIWPYWNERTKILSMLSLFATFYIQGYYGSLTPNSIMFNGNQSFDYIYLFHVLNCCYGNEEEAVRTYVYY